MSITRPYLVQSREQHEYNTDPQRRCYNGAHFSSELRWSNWATLYGLPTKEEAEQSVREWEQLAKESRRRLEYRVLYAPRTEVRCCCDAGRLLGTVPGVFPNADHVNFAMSDGSKLELPMGDVWLPRLPVFRAIKSMDTPVELLRQIPGWEDA